MTWQDRVDLLKYHASGSEEQRRLASNAINTLKDFLNELSTRAVFLPASMKIIDEVLNDIGEKL